jgi:hypothetical protein
MKNLRSKLKGCSFLSIAQYCKRTTLNDRQPSARYSGLGFRVFQEYR